MESKKTRQAPFIVESTLTKAEYDERTRLEREAMDALATNESTGLTPEQDSPSQTTQDASQRMREMNRRRFGVG